MTSADPGPAPTDGTPPWVRLLDQAMPTWQFAEIHGRFIRAPEDRVWSALLGLRVRDVTVTRVLMRARAGRRNVMGDGDAVALDALGPGEVARRENRELLLGLVIPLSSESRGRLEDLSMLRPQSIDELRADRGDGWAREGMDFRLFPLESGTRLLTETRVAVSGERARRAFRIYWRAIRGGSGLIRRDLLRAVAVSAKLPA